MAAQSMARIRQGGSDALDKLLHDTVSRKTTPAVFFLATNAGGTIYENQAGDKIFGDETKGAVTGETVMELFSQTKLITAIAAYQLVDRGVISLDSEEDVAKYLPELGDLPILKGYEGDGKPILEKATKRITLRMLLSHQAGCSYAIFPSALSAYHKLYPEDTDLLSSSASMATIAKPLLYEPGTSWSYGSAYIFIGKLVERASGLRLDRYFQQHIFDPLGVKSLTFYPTDEVKTASMAICARMPDQSVVALPPGAGVVRPTEVADVPTDMLLGGEGLFGTQRDFLVILRAVLQSDPSSPHHATNPILSASSFKELFTGCVTTEGGKQAIVDMFAPQGYFDPVISTANVDYSPGLLSNLEDFTGRRKAGSGCGYGILNTPFWIDPSTGLAGICATQLLSMGPDPCWDVYVAYEKELYAQLE